MVGPDAYCELHVHSNFSFLDGASHPEDLVARRPGSGCRRWPSPTTRACMPRSGCGRARRRPRPMTPAPRASPRWCRSWAWSWPFPAMSASCAWRGAGGAWRSTPRDEGQPRLAGGAPRRSRPRRPPRPAGPRPGGYAALSRIVSAGHLAGEKAFPVFEAAALEAALDEAKGHLIGLSGCRNGRSRGGCWPGSGPWPLRGGTVGPPLSRRGLLRGAVPPPAPRRRLARRRARRPPTKRACPRSSPTRSTTPRRPAIGSRTCWSPSATAPRSTTRASCASRTPSTGSRPAPARAARRRPARPRARRAWHDGMAQAATIGQACRLDLASSAIGSPASPFPTGRRPSPTCTSLPMTAYGAGIGPLPSRRWSS